MLKASMFMVGLSRYSARRRAAPQIKCIRFHVIVCDDSKEFRHADVRRALVAMVTQQVAAGPKTGLAYQANARGKAPNRSGSLTSVSKFLP
jgi:hypothetical protein